MAEPSVCHDCERLRTKNRNMRRALRDLNKQQRGRAEAIRHVLYAAPGALRADCMLENWGKVTQRNNELRKALGQLTEGHWQWPEMLEVVHKMRGQLAATKAAVERAKARAGNMNSTLAELIAELESVQ